MPNAYLATGKKLGRTRFAWDVPQGTGTAHLAWDNSLQSGITHSWDTPAKLGHPSQTRTTQLNWDSPPTRDVPQGTGTAHLAWDSSLQSGMTHSWDNPAKLGHPSQNGTTQPNWDSPPMWDVPHRVGRLNRLGRPMNEWDDPAVGHPTPSPGHTTQAGTSHTNRSIPSFSRLLCQSTEAAASPSRSPS